MRHPILIIAMLAFCLQGYSQIELNYYDLPKRGENYIKTVIPTIAQRLLPSNLKDSSETEQVYDFSNVSGVSEKDTLAYFWVEGTTAEFEFPDANMVDIDSANENYNYFVKDESGFYLSGNSGGYEAPTIGNLDIKAEFRPAVPLVLVPAKLGDEVSETSTASVDLLTFGKLFIKTDTYYKINGYGRAILPDNEEVDVLKFTRETNRQIITDISLGNQSITDTIFQNEISYEFYGKKYGDALVTVTEVIDENLGLEQFGISYREERIVSSIKNPQPTISLSLYPNPAQQYSIVSGEELSGKTIELYSLDGSLIMTKRARQNTVLIPTANLPNGSYLLKVNNGTTTLTTKTLQIQ